MNNRIRKVKTKEEMEQLIDDLITAGYTVESRGEENARLVKRGEKRNHLLVFLLTFWFTLGIGNLIYAAWPAKIEDEVLIKLQKPIPATD